MPNLIGGIVLGYIWKLLLDGVIVRFLDSTLALNATYGFWGLVLLLCWQQIGYMMIIYVAGLQNVSARSARCQSVATAPLPSGNRAGIGGNMPQSKARRSVH